MDNRKRETAYKTLQMSAYSGFPTCINAINGTNALIDILEKNNK